MEQHNILRKSIILVFISVALGMIGRRVGLSFHQAMALLLKMQISGLPVIGEKKRLMGMFTENDILRNVLPSYIERVGRFVYEENPKSIKKSSRICRT